MASRVALAALAAAALAATALAAHPARRYELRANLDRDPAVERVGVDDFASADHRTMKASVTLVDNCEGRRQNYRLGADVSVGAVRVVNADGRPRPEVFLWLGGIRPQTGTVKVVRLTGSTGRCPLPRSLLAYSGSRPPEPLAGLTLVALTAAIDDYSSAHRGREVQIVEQWRALGDLPARTERRLEFRYDARSGRYVRYGTKVIPRGPA